MTRMILACTTLALLVTPSHAQDAAQAPTDNRPTVTLAYKYIPDELLRYKMVTETTMDMDISTTTGQNMNIKPAVKTTSILRQRAKSIQPNGDAEVAIAFESMRMEVMGRTINVPTDKLPIMYMLISPTGVTKRIEGLGSAAGAGMDSISSMSDTNQFTALLPEGALHVGDAWTKTVPMPNMASGQIRADSQLLSVNTKVGDYTVAKIKQTLTGTFTQTVQVPARNGAPASTVNGGGNLSGDVTEYFSPAKGQLIKSTGTIKMHIGMAVPGVQAYGQPGSGSGNLTMKTTMILLPPAHK